MRKRVEEVLDALGIAHLRERRLDTLSGGERQRVAIAAVLTAQPRVLVLDEPTSALDPQSAEDVFSVLGRLRDELGLTIVCAEHRLERVVSFTDQVASSNGTRVDRPAARSLRARAVRAAGLDARPRARLAAAAAHRSRGPGVRCRHTVRTSGVAADRSRAKRRCACEGLARRSRRARGCARRVAAAAPRRDRRARRTQRRRQDDAAARAWPASSSRREERSPSTTNPSPAHRDGSSPRENAIGGRPTVLPTSRSGPRCCCSATPFAPSWRHRLRRRRKPASGFAGSDCSILPTDTRGRFLPASVCGPHSGTAFVRSPDVYLLDEPTRGLDPPGKDRLARDPAGEGRRRCGRPSRHARRRARRARGRPRAPVGRRRHRRVGPGARRARRIAAVLVSDLEGHGRPALPHPRRRDPRMPADVPEIDHVEAIHQDETDIEESSDPE